MVTMVQNYNPYSDAFQPILLHVVVVGNQVDKNRVFKFNCLCFMQSVNIVNKIFKFAPINRHGPHYYVRRRDSRVTRVG